MTPTAGFGSRGSGVGVIRDFFRRSLHRTLYTRHLNGGFTLIEVLLVLGILTVLLGVLVPLSRRFQTSALLDVETDLLVADLRRAQVSALAGTADTAHGVHIDVTPENVWYVFEGNTFVPGGAGSVSHPTPSSVTITSVVLAGGGHEIVFAERRGTTAQTGTLTLTGPNSETRTVSVNSAGTLEVQ